MPKLIEQFDKFLSDTNWVIFTAIGFAVPFMDKLPQVLYFIGGFWLGKAYIKSFWKVYKEEYLEENSDD